MGPSLSRPVRRTRHYVRDVLLPHVGGALLGGTGVGLLAAGLGSLLAELDARGALVLLGLVLVVLYAASDVVPLTVWRPDSPWQVPQSFIRTPYARTAALLWGIGLGFGWLTHQPTTAFLTLFIAMLVVPAEAALAAGAIFGVARALTIMPGMGLDDPRAVERRYDGIRSHRYVPGVGSALSGAVVAAGLVMSL